ncbi:MAG: hypothetical protein GHCLOJNM_03799 [bacterium]|nr:hypothetical protein [bacterium]
MRAFRFRLEKLLRFREHLEDLQRIEAEEQRRKLEETMGFRDRLYGIHDQIREDLSPEVGRQWKGIEQHERYRYLLRLNQECSSAGKAVQDETQELVRKRQSLIERSRDRKVLERLRDRRLEHWRGDRERESQLELDEVGQTRRAGGSSESGRAALLILLLVLCLAGGVGCYLVWSGWLSGGGVPFPILRKPFDQMAQRHVEQEITRYEDQQRARRAKREERFLQAGGPEAAALAGTKEDEGYRRTAQLIRQREEALKKKEEDLDSRESMLRVAEDEFKREVTRNNNLLRRIGEQLEELKAIEARRKQEMGAEREAKLTDLMESIKSMTEKGAAKLLIAVAFPNLAGGAPPALPVGQDLEGLELVVEILHRTPDRQRAAILDAMVKTNPKEAGILFDRLDNIRTGLEEDRFFEKPTGS